MFFPLKDENPTSRFPIITVVLITLNSLIFLGQLFSPHGLAVSIYKMGAIPFEITHWQSPPDFPISRISPLLSLVVSLFLHGGFLHLAGNMLFLWIFGNNVEDYLGPIRFILYYFVCGLGASLIHVLFNPNSMVPMVGASGAIAGILGAYFLLYPGAKVLTLVFLFFFIRVIPIPAAFFLGLWFIAQILNVGLGGGVAWFAHIGGFLIGMGLIRIYAQRRRKG
ncbi:MAG: rhomboid family intramembrane serine protease [Candidatus Aminicenantales bacterium]